LRGLDMGGRVSGLGFRISSFRFRVLNFRLKVKAQSLLAQSNYQMLHAMIL
jgi:hypothetical protein